MQITKNDAVISLNLTESFNRYVLSYSADIPLRCTLTYAEQGHERTEEFFLEAGEDMTFASYMDGYLRHGRTLFFAHQKIPSKKKELGSYKTRKLVKYVPVCFLILFL